MRRQLAYSLLGILSLLPACGRQAMQTQSGSDQKVALVKSAEGTYYKYYCLKGKNPEQMGDCAVDPSTVNSVQSQQRGFLGGGDALTQFLIFNLLGYPQQQVCGFLWNRQNCYQDYFQFDPSQLTNLNPSNTCHPDVVVPPVIAAFDPFAVAIQSQIRQIRGCYGPWDQNQGNTVPVNRLHQDLSDGTRDYMFASYNRNSPSEFHLTYPNAIDDGIRFRLYPNSQGNFNVALYACYVSTPAGKKHFLSRDAGCEGQAMDHFAGTLGYMSATQQPNTIALHRWYNPRTGGHQDLIWQYVPADAAALGWIDEGIQGYVPQY